MKNIYKLSLPLIGFILMSSTLNAQVYKIAEDGIYYPGGISENGVVSMNGGNVVFIWDQVNGLQNIGEATTESDFGGSVVISEDGTKVSAGVTNPSTSLNEIAIYDVASQTWTYKGGLDTVGIDGSLSSSWGMSADGSTVVGLGWLNGGGAHAIKWDAVNGITDMGSTIPDSSSRANAISTDKNVVVGWQDQADGYRTGARWVNGVQEFLKDSNGEFIGEAGGVSADGKVVIGSNGLFPYVWNETAVYQEITHPNSGPFFRGGAVGISDDGKTVVGYFRSWPGGPMMGEGFIWTQEDGRRNLNDYVSSLGMDTLGITFGLPLAISRDGKKIAGIGMNDAFQPVTFMIDLSSALATHNVKTEKFSIYPNPVKDILNINGVGKIENVEIYNLVGQKMKSATASSKIDVSSLSKGVYLINIISNGQKQSIKFIKE